MRKKINRMLVLIATLAICSSMLLLTFVYYNLFKKQVVDDLRDYTVLMLGYRDMNQVELAGERLLPRNIRVTWISQDGCVQYDSMADYANMENHSERPEIRKAFEQGEGLDIRRSETLSRSTFYYAMLTEEGNVLRISKNVGSIYSILTSALPSMALILVLLLLLCLFVARVLTRYLIRPIEHLAENMDGECEPMNYEELAPFIEVIRKQHLDILNSAKVRQEFTANVSHELKTPLTSISGYAELIETGMASEEDTVRFAHGIYSNAKRLLTLINDIIRLSELDGSEEQVAYERLNLYELASACVEMLSMNAEKHGITIRLSGAECYMNANKQMMEELLFNLCDNAIRYNNEGGRVEVEVYPRKGRVVLVVRDTGIGIPKEHQERIFERFYRVDKSRSKSTGGTGLGLAIVKHILSLHHAELQLDSKEGKGTTFTIIFPA